MTGVAYGFRDDLTEDEIDELIRRGIVMECSEHFALEAVPSPERFDAAIARMRKRNAPQTG